MKRLPALLPYLLLAAYLAEIAYTAAVSMPDRPVDPVVWSGR